MEELSFDIPCIECAKCNYEFKDGDIIYYNQKSEGYLELNDVLNWRHNDVYCEECQDTVYCEDCNDLHDNCECLN